MRAQAIQAESEAPFCVADLQSELADDEAVLDYYIGPSSAHAGVIGRGSLRVLRLPVSGLREVSVLNSSLQQGKWPYAAFSSS